MTVFARRHIIAACVAVGLSGCVGGGTFDPGTANTGADNRRAFPAVRISASWAGGKTGSPSALTVTPPPGSFGTLCAATSFVVENHPTQYTSAFADGGASLLVIGSNCTLPTFFAVCRSGAAGQTSVFGTCASDPTLTEASNATVLRVGAGTTARPVSFGPTSTALDVELFFCSDLSDFNFSLAHPKPGVAPTACVEK